jgi:hypothetical protein
MGEDLAYRYFAYIDTYGHFIAATAQTDGTALLGHRMNMFIPDILVPPDKLPLLIHAIM